MPKKFERCVKAVKAKGKRYYYKDGVRKESNPYAICRSALKGKMSAKRSVNPLDIPASSIKHFTKTGRGYERVDLRKRKDREKAWMKGLWLGDASSKTYTKITKGSKKPYGVF